MKIAGRALLIFGIICTILSVVVFVGLSYIEDEVQAHERELAILNKADEYGVRGLLDKVLDHFDAGLTDSQRFGLYVYDHADSFRTGGVIALVVGILSAIAGTTLTILCLVEQSDRKRT